MDKASKRSNSLVEHAERSNRLLRRAVRDAVSAHYKAGRAVVYQEDGKIYRTDQPGQKGRVIATVSSKAK